MEAKNDIHLKSNSKRKLLVWFTHIFAIIGAAFAVTPFIKSFNPSRRAKAIGAPVDVDLSEISPGEMKVVKWRGQPVWVLRRTPKMIESLSLVNDLLADPNSKQSIQPKYAKGDGRAIENEWMVAIGICTHLGCSPLFKPEKGGDDLGKDWQGGFFCPCHGSKFDLSGRVYKNMPAPTNLTIPLYEFVDNKTIRIGTSKEAA